MRRRDWADDIADSFISIIAEIGEVDAAPRIAVELRQAFFKGLDHVPVKDEEETRQGHRYIYRLSVAVEDGQKAQDKEWLKANATKTYVKKIPSG